MFKKGNLVRLKTDDGSGEILSITEDVTEDENELIRCEDSKGITLRYYPSELELVKESQEIPDKVENPQPMEEQTVAIVSFEGAVKREVLAVREAIKCCDTISHFELTVVASGAVNDGDVKVTYSIAEDSYGTKKVKGNNVKECLSEFLRRHGWDRVNKPIAISYDGIPT